MQRTICAKVVRESIVLFFYCLQREQLKYFLHCILRLRGRFTRSLTIQLSSCCDTRRTIWRAGHLLGSCLVLYRFVDSCSWRASSVKSSLVRLRICCSLTTWPSWTSSLERETRRLANFLLDQLLPPAFYWFCTESLPPCGQGKMISM